MSVISKSAVQIIQSKCILPRMQEKNITQYKLAQLTGISKGMLSLWFAGKSDISLTNFLSILKALEINPLFAPKEMSEIPDHQLFFN